MRHHQQRTQKHLYTPDQQKRRDQTRWTLVQGVLAPLQFFVFLISAYLVIRFLQTGMGFEAATLSVLIKTLCLYLIMVTGAIWEKVVFRKYLFADAFFWEDAVSMIVIVLHTAYLICWYFNLLEPSSQMLLALAAYTVYVINAAQFIIKLRAARLQRQSAPTSTKTLSRNINYMRSVAE